MLFLKNHKGICFQILPFLLLSLFNTAFSQPDSLWSRAYGGIRRDMIRCTRQTADGGFVSTGYYSVFWNEQDLISPDLWVLKTDPLGEIEWERLYGIPGEESGYWIEQTSDGGYIVGGSIYIQGTGQEALAMKIDENGNEQWSYISSNPMGPSYCRCIKETSDGGYVLAAEYATILTDIVLVKLDSLGQEEWTRQYSGTSFSWDYPRYVEQTLDGGYILTGTFNDYYSNSSSLFLLKTDQLGEEEWYNYYGGDSYDQGSCVHHVNGDGYIAVGTFCSSNSEEDLWLLRVDEGGNTIWSRKYGGAHEDRGYNVELTNDNGFFATGFTFSFGSGEEDLYALRTDSAGEIIWQRAFGGTERDIGYCGAQLNEGGYIVSGYTYSFSQGPLFDGWVLRIGSDLGIEDAGSSTEPSLTTHPSPFSNTLRIDLQLPGNCTASLNIYDIAGRLIDSVFQGEMQRGTNSFSWQPSGTTPSGCYLVHLQGEALSLVGKCVLVR